MLRPSNAFTVLTTVRLIILSQWVILQVYYNIVFMYEIAIVNFSLVSFL